MIGSVRRCLLGLVLLAAVLGFSQADGNGSRPVVRDPAADVTSRPLLPVPQTAQPFTHSLRFFHSRAGGFSQVARAAGTIFSGTVTRIERRPAIFGETVEVVAVTFHVENAIRGATSGSDITILEWIGLWSAGQRYYRGERVLLFLYPPSRLGLTSVVGGALGRFSLDARGRVLLSPQHVSAFRWDPVLGGKSRVRFGDFALEVRRASEEDQAQ